MEPMRKATKATKQTRKTPSKKTKAAAPPKSAAKSDEPADWRSETLARVRKLINAADPQIIETVKWKKPSNAMRGVPVWEKDGILCTGERYKDKVKLTFANGASLDDPSGLFNAGLAGGVRRAIDIGEGEKIDEKAFKALIREAAGLNAERAAARGVRVRKKAKRA
jgi:hypothetical protein